MKLRSFLYDAGCSACTKVAQEAEAQADGWLHVKPLHDAQMRALLARVAPDFKPRPALVTQDGDQVTVDTGWKMLAKLMLGMGPRRCWRLLRLLAQVRPQPAQDHPSGRRKLLRTVGGGTLATLTTFVMADPEKAPEQEATLVTDETREAVLAAVGGEAHVQIADQQLRGLGFLPSTEGAVVLRFKAGDQLTLMFYPDAGGRPDRAGVMVHERLGDGTVRVLMETLEGDPRELFDAAGRYREGALRTTASMRVAENGGLVVPTSARAYFACMFLCVGGTCARAAATCTRLPFLALALACIVGFCAARARSCHPGCRVLW